MEKLKREKQSVQKYGNKKQSLLHKSKAQKWS